MPPDLSSIGPGDVVADRYRIEELVGQGGFGAVFRAVQIPINRVVALKFVTPQSKADPSRVKRFYLEAQIVQRLNHPNTVRLYDFGQTDAGIPFIAWEFLEGRPLDVALAEDGPFSPERVVRVATQVAKALMEAHGLGFVHRDIKPANIYLCDYAGEPDFVKVLDFGVAKVFSPEANMNTLRSLTVTGQLLGTPHYTAPELVLGQPPTPAVDVYALGLVMAELLTSARVFDSPRKVDVYFQHVADAPVPLGRLVLDSPIGDVIDKATRKSLAERYSTAAELLAALQDARIGLSRSSGASSTARAAAPTPLSPPGEVTTEETAAPFAETVDATWDPEAQTWGGLADPSELAPLSTTLPEVSRPPWMPARALASDPARPARSPVSTDEHLAIPHRVTIDESQLDSADRGILMGGGAPTTPPLEQSRPLAKTVLLDSVPAVPARAPTVPVATGPGIHRPLNEPVAPPRPPTGGRHPVTVPAPPRREDRATVPMPPKPRRRRGLWLFVAAIAVGLLLAAVFGVVFWAWFDTIVEAVHKLAG